VKSLLVHGILAVAGLVLAYRVWAERDAPEVAADAVTLVDCEPSRVTAVELFEADRQKRVRLDIDRSGEDPAYRFTVTRYERKRADEGSEEGQGGTSEPATAEGAEEEAGAGDVAAKDASKSELVATEDPPKRFLGSESVSELLEQIAPLRAVRSLGTPKPELLEEIELDDPQGMLTLVCSGEERTFELGSTTTGAGDRYAKPRGKDAVYLLAADALRDLQSAEFRMIQRDYQTFDWAEVASLTLEIGDQQERLLQRNRLDQDKAQWVDADEPDRRNELFDNFMSRVKRLRVQDYLAKDAAPGADLDADKRAGDPQDVLSLVYRDEAGGELGRLDLARVESETSTWFYGRSGVTGGWTSLLRNVGVQVEDDARLILSLDPVERPEDRVSESRPASSEEAETADGAGADVDGDGADEPSDASEESPAAGGPGPSRTSAPAGLPTGHPPVGSQPDPG